jgi:hypothetical protein
MSRVNWALIRLAFQNSGYANCWQIAGSRIVNGIQHGLLGTFHFMSAEVSYRTGGNFISILLQTFFYKISFSSFSLITVLIRDFW